MSCSSNCPWQHSSLSPVYITYSVLGHRGLVVVEVVILKVLIGSLKKLSTLYGVYTISVVSFHISISKDF